MVWISRILWRREIIEKAFNNIDLDARQRVAKLTEMIDEQHLRQKSLELAIQFSGQEYICQSTQELLYVAELIYGYLTSKSNKYRGIEEISITHEDLKFHEICVESTKVGLSSTKPVKINQTGSTLEITT